MGTKTVAQIYKEETGLDAMWRSASAEDHGLAVYIEAPTQAYFSWLEKRAAEKCGMAALQTANNARNAIALVRQFARDNGHSEGGVMDQYLDRLEERATASVA